MIMMLKFFDWLYGRHKGFLILTYGKKEIRVFVKKRPKKVWISGTTISCAPYTIERDFTSVELLCNGFILYADVKSNIFKVDWVVE